MDADVIRYIDGRMQRLDTLLSQLQSRAPKRGVGDPNGVVAGSPGDLYVDSAGVAGATAWFKEQGVNTTADWVSL